MQPKHLIFIFRSENGHSDALYPLNLARSESDQKSLNNPKIDRFDLFYLVQWACILQIIAFYVSNEFWVIRRQKVLIKFFFSFCHRKSMIFRKKISKTPKSTYLSSEIQLDGFPMWFQLKISGKNQKMDFGKSVPEMCKFLLTWSLKRFYASQKQ